MYRPFCHHENLLGAKFCEHCAAPLKRHCASCGVELRPSAKYRADARQALATALRAAGRVAGAQIEIRLAIQLWETKPRRSVTDSAEPTRISPRSRHFHTTLK